MSMHRIALNMDQVREFDPPPNPTKIGDSRTSGYVREFGEECWELDALEPAVVTGLINEAVLELRDEDIWVAAVEKQEQHKADLKAVAEDWDTAVAAVQ